MDVEQIHCYSVSLDSKQLQSTLTDRLADGKMEGTYT